MYSYTKNGKVENFKTGFPLIASLCEPVEIKRLDGNLEIETGLLLSWNEKMITAKNMNELAAVSANTLFFQDANEWIAYRDLNGIIEEEK